MEVRRPHALSKGKRTVQPLSRVSNAGMWSSKSSEFSIMEIPFKKKQKQKKNAYRRQRLSEGHSCPWLPWKLRPGHSLQALLSGLMVFAPPGGTVQPLRGFPAPSPVQGNHFLKLETSLTLSFAVSKPGNSLFSWGFNVLETKARKTCSLFLPVHCHPCRRPMYLL